MMSCVSAYGCGDVPMDDTAPTSMPDFVLNVNSYWALPTSTVSPDAASGVDTVLSALPGAVPHTRKVADPVAGKLVARKWRMYGCCSYLSHATYQ